MSKSNRVTWLLSVVVLSILLTGAIELVSPARLALSQTSPSSADGEPLLLRAIYAKVNPSVVSITVRLPVTNASVQGNPNGDQAYQEAAGSGFVYDISGHIVTNAHVVNQATNVQVTFSDSTIMRAKVIGIDLDSDLAVIQVSGDASKYAPVPLGDSDGLAVGDRAIAIGNPFEKAGTMTQGIVSGLHRSVSGLQPSGGTTTYTIPDAIQTDAAVNPGNSGGPLLNGDGEVIGVTEQIASQVRQSSGVSFAISSNLVKLIVPALLKGGKVAHSYLGISSVALDLDIDDALNVPESTRGLYVLAIQPGSPAAKAGLKGAARATSANAVPAGGDMILAIDGQPLIHADDLTAYIFTKTTPGQTIKLTVLRAGKQQDISVTLSPRPNE